jgi:hypothetical protein
LSSTLNSFSEPPSSAVASSLRSVFSHSAVMHLLPPTPSYFLADSASSAAPRPAAAAAARPPLPPLAEADDGDATAPAEPQRPLRTTPRGAINIRRVAAEQAARAAADAAGS